MSEETVSKQPETLKSVTVQSERRMKREEGDDRERERERWRGGERDLKRE